MDQTISLKIIRIIVVITHDYLKYCNASLLIYKGWTPWSKMQPPRHCLEVDSSEYA